jgi:hypothetical protein
MRRVACLLLLALAGVARIGSQPLAQDPPGQSEAPRQTFLQRVDDYVALHRHLELLLPPEVITSDPERLMVPRRALAAELRTARAGARQGDIFSPDVARYFRTLIAETLRQAGITDLLETIEDENTVKLVPRVNGDYPAGASVSMMPPSLLAALPPLPAELEYRFAGRDLILWDLHPSLIVDFVPNAVPVATERPFTAAARTSQ